MSTALSVGFQRILHRARPTPVGSSYRVEGFERDGLGREMAPCTDEPGGRGALRDTRASVEQGTRRISTS